MTIQYEDLPGSAIGQWTVLHEVEKRPPYRYFLCRCSCGAEHEVNGYSLRRGASSMCAFCSRQQMGKRKRAPKPEHNLVGKTFSSWTVESEIFDHSQQGRHFLCLCKCGNKSPVRGIDLRQGRSTRCRQCARAETSTLHEMLGARFGKWTVLECSGRRFDSYQFLCKCDCGTTKKLHGPALRRGDTTQCTKCANIKKARNNRTHGRSKTRLYKVWSSMKSRCQDPNSNAYKWYGARGIQVCERWQLFENFIEDMGIPNPGLTIDRIDNDGNYEPGNCRWVSHAENMRNRRNSKRNNTQGRVQ